MNRKDFLKNSALVAAAMGVSRFTLHASCVVQNSIVGKYYGDPDDVSDVGRARKMQALIMELAIKAKSRNPKFQVVPQDTLEYAHIDGNPNNQYDTNLTKLLGGWGIENFSPLTVTRLANLTKIGIKGTANTNGKTVKIVTDNQKIASDNNILWHPRLSAEVYRSPGIGNPGYMPIYSPSSNAYNIIHHPIPAGVAHTLNSNDVNKMMDAKNHLYMISTGMYANWPSWEKDPERLDITNTPGFLVPFADGRFKPTGKAEVVAQAIKDHGDKWDFFWVAKGYKQDEGRKAYIKELAASQWDAFYIDTHFDGDSLTMEEVEMLKHKPQGGRRQVIAYLSIGTMELGRWFVDPVMVETNPRAFRNGSVENGKFIPSSERFSNTGVPDWILWPAYSGQYAEESTPIWWHPEWRDIIIRGGSKYKNPRFNNSRFPDGRSSIDRIVDVGFDGVYLDNVSRATTSGANWTALQAYNNAHPKWYLGEK
jgi:endo-alpha-1,4-polygalactosaminidase (GH114 family)